MIRYLTRLIPCWPFFHRWTEWVHDDHYHKEFDAQFSSCYRQRWYSNRQRKWKGKVHFQHKRQGVIQ